MRIGHGYDVHKFCDGRKLFLGGVEIPYDKGLLGHSDADVLIHAVCDAILGAAALGDIGKHFPDSDPKYKNIDSKILLKNVAEKISVSGYKIINIDATVIAQKPKISSYIDEMRRTLCKILGVADGDINIKATTEEGLGFTGRLEGISAHAVCLIEKE